MQRLCRLFNCPKSTFYGREKVEAERVDKYAELRERTIDIFTESRGSAGQRTVVNVLASKNITTTRFIIRKLFNEEGLVSKQRRSNPYKKANKPSEIAPNLLDRCFDVGAPDSWWCGDVTYIWTQQGWCYLAAVLDLYSRKIVGFSVSKNPDSKLTKKALLMAFESRGRPQNLVFHSDQGCHYTSEEFRAQLDEYSIVQSMSRRGNCWDNAPMERFFGSLKSEWIPKLGYEDLADAVDDMRNYIHDYYNVDRPHTHNEGLSPTKAEARFQLELKKMLAGNKQAS